MNIDKIRSLCHEGRFSEAIVLSTPNSLSREYIDCFVIIAGEDEPIMQDKVMETQEWGYRQTGCGFISSYPKEPEAMRWEHSFSPEKSGAYIFDVKK